MALPARLKSALRPLGAVGKSISPTGIGVLLSVGAHVLLIAASSAQGSSSSTGGGGGGLFDAFDEAADEKIVPIVQLTPAERSRLPAFAQPRLDPLSASSLSNLDLPPGLLAPSATLGQRGTSIPAARMPSATSPRQFAATPPIDDVLRRLKANVAAAPTRPQSPVSINIPRRTPTSAYIPTEPSVIVPPPPPAGSGNGGTIIPSGSAADLGQLDISGLPRLEPQSTENILAGLQNQPSTEPSETPAASEGQNGAEANDTPTETNAGSGTESVDIAIENSGPGVTTLALKPADGDAAALRDELTYDARLTSEEAVSRKVESWSDLVAQRGDLPQAVEEVEIPAAFKACRENPPTDGLLGVIVDQNGEVEDFDVLKSTGYETINLRAQQAVENHDFSSVSETTEYRFKVKVNYDADNCVDVEGLKERLVN